MANSATASHSGMKNMDLQEVDGVKYPTFGLTNDIAKQLKTIRNLDLEDDDVICVGYPRTGNHLLFEIVSMILRQDSTFTDKLFFTYVLELMGDDVQEKIQKMPSPRCLFTHHRVHRIPLQAIKKRIKLIFPMRNPKDILVSMYRLTSSFIKGDHQFTGTWDEFFELQIAGEFQWGSWFNHVLAMEKFMEEHPEHPVYFFSFEKMKSDRLGVIKELCSFLGKPHTLAEEIEKVTEFKSMKKELMSGKMMAEQKILKDGSDALFRSGSVGGWKNYFTVAQSERFDKAFEEKLGSSSLARMVSDFL